MRAPWGPLGSSTTYFLTRPDGSKTGRLEECDAADPEPAGAHGGAARRAIAGDV